ncbi:MAG TPA: FtsX-like permease family protein [Blastocatellia bacterium]|nr:FtsX-like permease family protein [Blastocatellia bacterium]
MNFTDIMGLAWRNLRQARLRTSLTMVGVIVGVAAIVTLVSFGIGLQRNILGQALSRLDVFTSITVRGASADALLELNEGRTVLDEAGNGEPEKNGDQKAEAKTEPGRKDGSEDRLPDGRRAFPTLSRRVLDDETITELQRIKGVRYALPIVSFNCYARYNERVRRLYIVGLPAHLEDNPRFRKFLAGQTFSSDDAQEVVVSEDLLAAFSAKAYQQRRAGRRRSEGPWRPLATRSEEERAADAQKVIGQEIVLMTPPAAESEPSSVFGIPILKAASPEPGPNPELNGQQFDQHRFRIVGVLPSEGEFNINALLNTKIAVPMEVAKRFRETNQDPMERLGETLAGDSGYSLAEVRVIDPMQIKPVMAQIDKMGFRTFSLTNQLEEINRIFLIVNSSLALIGGIALFVASFGISNTMIMSIRERTREIGIMKAIGGSDGEIMRIFFIEASLIGLAGGIVGVMVGWGIDRIANIFANRWILKHATEDIRYIEFFSIPWYLAVGAVIFAVLISLIAAIYPALGAAKVDPIKALRYE